MGSRPASVVLLTSGESLSSPPWSPVETRPVPEVASEALSGADRKGHVCHFPVSLPSSALDAVRRDFSSIYFVPEAVLADRERGFAGPVVSGSGPAWGQLNKQGTRGGEGQTS